MGFLSFNRKVFAVFPSPFLSFPPTLVLSSQGTRPASHPISQAFSLEPVYLSKAPSVFAPHLLRSYLLFQNCSSALSSPSKMVSNGAGEMDRWLRTFSPLIRVSASMRCRNAPWLQRQSISCPLLASPGSVTHMMRTFIPAGKVLTYMKYISLKEKDGEDPPNSSTLFESRLFFWTHMCVM